ncbi:toprim domain-containing protein [Halorubrum halodurans]|uniref:DNA primase catalytic core N-terminal domain-containing protein n=1 Tax=Halorubrum halodurans TaxID=1383851 RepID=A0A256IKA1_9EURY|nr:toprim domain-containing protein [Halorubrum halodurans]OYR56978.1 hypothetical protein DJ70_07120 [Halorubrum halodurans]
MRTQGDVAPDAFLLDTTPDTVAGNRHDTDTVQNCIADAVEYYHDNLPGEIREHITEKWGISNEIIDTRKIGFESSGNAVIEHLENAGYDPVTITRAGIGTIPVLKHVLECSGISGENTGILTHLGTSDDIPDSMRDEHVDSNCSHTNIPEPIDRLALAVSTNRIEPETIDVDAVVSYYNDHSDTGGVSVWSWWDNRIIFPYRDADGDFCYLIGRATDDTDDKVYSNGVVDRSDQVCTTIADTVLADAAVRDRDDIPSEVLDDFIVLPHAVTRFNSPYKDEYAEFTDTVLDVLERHAATGDVPGTELRELGLLHAPDSAAALRESGTTQLHVLPRDVIGNNTHGSDSAEFEYVLTPPAVGVSPGTAVDVVNHTDADVTVTSTLLDTPPNPDGDGERVALRELADDPDKFSDSTVTVRGVVTELFELTDAQTDWIAQRGVIADGTGTRLFTIPDRAIDAGDVTRVEPGSAYEFTGVTGNLYDGDVSVTVTRDSTVTELTTDVTGTHRIDCADRGLHRFTIDVAGEQHHGMFTVFDDVHTDRRSPIIEDWVGGEPTFDVDVPKYLKQTIDREWINRDAVQEPIFGVETVHEGKPLIVTEGVTDAIMAHQHGFPCVAPVTTNFKKHHYEEICQHAAKTSGVFVVNDTEINDAGINGALRTAKVIENDGHTVKVGELPLPDGERKIDVAEFLRTHDSDAFLDVLNDAVAPEDHAVYDAERHDPEHRTGRQSGSNGAGESSNTSTSDFDAGASTGNTSALFSLELRDVIDLNSLDTGGNAGSTVYRGSHPIQHHGDSTGYFVIRRQDDGGISAKDYKIESNGDGYYYNALTWLATAAQCDCGAGTACECTRSVTRPMGEMSHSEIWWAWHHAKTADHIPIPDDDPVPVRAMWFLAEHHNVIPSEFIPETWEDGKQLPQSKYNEVIGIIRDEYGLNPGRGKR